jgi:hypothetical protein
MAKLSRKERLKRDARFAERSLRRVENERESRLNRLSYAISMQPILDAITEDADLVSRAVLSHLMRQEFLWKTNWGGEILYASVDDIAAELGLDVEEVRQALRFWGERIPGLEVTFHALGMVDLKYSTPNWPAVAVADRIAIPQSSLALFQRAS